MLSRTDKPIGARREVLGHAPLRFEDERGQRAKRQIISRSLHYGTRDRRETAGRQAPADEPFTRNDNDEMPSRQPRSSRKVGQPPSRGVHAVATDEGMVTVLVRQRMRGEELTGRLLCWNARGGGFQSDAGMVLWRRLPERLDEGPCRCGPGSRITRISRPAHRDRK